MRVLMFGWEFPPHISGGLGSACEGMVKALTSHGTQVTFVLPKLLPGTGDAGNSGLAMRGVSGMRVPGSVSSFTTSTTRTQTDEFWRKNLRIEPIDSLLVPYCTPETYTEVREDWERRLSTLTNTDSTTTTRTAEGFTLHLEGGYGKDLMSEVYRYSLAARLLAQNEDFDVIHAHDWMAYPAGIMAREVSGKPLVVHVHATEADRSGSGMNPVVSHIEWEGMHAADRVVAVSHYTKNLIMRVYGVPEEKISVVHNAVTRKEACATYHPEKRSDQSKQVLFMGRVTYQKGPDYFIEAARLVLKRLPNTRFVMAGSGDMLNKMVARVAKYRMGRRFTFTGFLKGSDVDRMYASSDLYVMPSVSEPFGIAPLEAMVYDIPVLMSKQSGVSEVITNALKVNFWDVRDMAAQICAVLAYPALSRLMVRNCQQELKQIRWDNAAVKLNQIYEEMTRRGN